jgi:hypothetical protein
MNKDKALDLALEALEELQPDDAYPYSLQSKAITAIKQARSAPVQEPHKELSEHMMQATNGRLRIDPVTGNAGIGTLPAAPVQEWMKPHPKCDEACLFQCTKGFTQFPECAKPAPVQEPAIKQGWDVDTLLDKPAAQRQWVSLTDEERYELLDKAYNPESYAVLIEAKLKEKNNG